MSAYKRTLKKQTSYEKRCNRTVKERLRWGWTVKAQLTVSRSGHGAHLSSMWEMKWAFRVLSEGLRAQPLCSVNDQLFGYLRFYIWEQDPKRTQCSSLPGHTHTHTHTHTSISLFPPEQSSEEKWKTILSSVNSARFLATNLQFSPQLQGPHSFLKGQVE